MKIETVKLFFQDNGKGMPHDDIPNMLGRGLLQSDLITEKFTIYDVNIMAHFYTILLMTCSSIWDKVWLKANTWKIWTWSKDGDAFFFFCVLFLFDSSSWRELLASYSIYMLLM